MKNTSTILFLQAKKKHSKSNEQQQMKIIKYEFVGHITYKKQMKTVLEINTKNLHLTIKHANNQISFSFFFPVKK